MRKLKILLSIGAAIVLSALTLSATSSAAQTWPQRSVKFIVPLGPGSGTDVTARLVGDYLSRRWGQAVVVENRPGADGIVGLAAFLNAHDDHTLLFAPTGTFAAHPFLHDKLPYDQRALVPIASVAKTVLAVSVPASLKVNSLAELMASARAQPGTLRWATGTAATAFIFTGFQKEVGVSMTMIPYRDQGQGINDLAEGRIQVFLSAIISAVPQVAAGKLKLLAVTNSERAPLVPSVPTVREAGYPALEYDGLIGIFGAQGMPDALRERIAADVRAIVTDPTVASRLQGLGEIVSPGTPAEFAASMDDQRARLTAFAHALGIKSAQ
jgi:tripartite-type tricarboxylate transporter receptor subunit TctC